MMTLINGTLSRSIVSSNVIQQIRSDILTRALKPNTKLTELFICKQYGISRSPARSIMQQLEKEGMLKMLDNGCKQITEICKEDIVNLYEFRNYLELWAVKKICSSKNKNYSPLLQVLDSLESLGNDQNTDYLTADVQFHRAIIEMSGNLFNLAAYDNIAPILYTVFLVSISTYEEQFFLEFKDRHNKLIKSLISDEESICLEYFKEHHDYALDKAMIIMDKIESGEVLE